MGVAAASPRTLPAPPPPRTRTVVPGVKTRAAPALTPAEEIQSRAREVKAEARSPLHHLVIRSHSRTHVWRPPCARRSQIVDLTGLTGLTNLQLLYARKNRIVHLTPLVGNSGIAAMDYLLFTQNPIDCAADTIDIAALLARGVSLLADCP